MKKLLMVSLAFAVILTIPACKKLACKKDKAGMVTDAAIPVMPKK